jgi:hypothetical protein
LRVVAGSIKFFAETTLEFLNIPLNIYDAFGNVMTFAKSSLYNKLIMLPSTSNSAQLASSSALNLHSYPSELASAVA